MVSRLIEFLCLPVPAGTIATFLLDASLEAQNTKSPLRYLVTTGYLFALLPTTFHVTLYQRCLQLLKQHLFDVLTNSNLQVGASHCHFAKNYSENMANGVHNIPNKVLLLLHSFWNYSSAENLLVIPEMIKNIRQSPSLGTVFFLCKMIAPFLTRISSKTELFTVVVVEVFRSLVDISQLVEGVAENGGDSSSGQFGPEEMLETIVDFL